MKKKYPEIVVFEDRSMKKEKWCGISSVSLIPIPFFPLDSVVLRNENGAVYGYYWGNRAYSRSFTGDVNFAVRKAEDESCKTIRELLDKSMISRGFFVLRP